MSIYEYKKGLFLNERQVNFNYKLTDEQKKLVDTRFEFWKEYATNENSKLSASFFHKKNILEEQFKLFLTEENFSIIKNKELIDWEENIDAIETKKFEKIELPKLESNQTGNEPLFVNFLFPFIKLGIGKVKSNKKLQSNLFYSEKILYQFTQKLAESIFNASMRTLILELNIFKDKSSKEENVVERFNELLNDHSFFILLLKKYPVLFRGISSIVNNWVGNLELFFEVLEKDSSELSIFFNEGQQLAELVNITGNSDAHNGGKSVLILEFSDGFNLVYKPHSMDAEKRFNHLLSQLNRLSSKDMFYISKIINKESYAWMGFVENKGCKTKQEFSKYYHRMGNLLAVLNTFRVSDIHFENLIACGTYPVLVDNEVIFTNEVTFDQIETASDILEEKLYYSVKNVGILPSLIRGIDISAIGTIQEQKIPYKMPTMRKDQNDVWKIDYDYGDIKQANNIPYLEDDKAALDINFYVDDITSGFKETYQLIESFDEAVIEKIINEFKGTQVRYIAKPTQTYANLLNLSSHPDFLRSGLDREMLFDRLWRYEMEDVNSLIQEELNDLLRGDIPYFLTNPFDTYIVHTTKKVDNYFSDSSIKNIKKYIQETMGAYDLDFQLKIIDLSFVGERDKKNHGLTPQFHLKDYTLNDIEKLNTQLLGIAEKIAKQLTKDAFIGTNEDVTWLTASLFGENEDTLGLLPVGLSLYDGVAGIALFFTQLVNITKKDRYKEIVERCYLSIKYGIEQIRNLSYESAEVTNGAFEGAPSIIYALEMMSSVLPEKKDEINNLIEELFEEISEKIQEDSNYDILLGSAGCILVLLNQFESTRSDKFLKLAKQVGNYLLEKATNQSNMMMWQPVVASNPLAGYSHGASGIAYALMLLAKNSNDNRYYNAAVSALEYERTLFIEEKGNWADKREFEGTEYSDLNELPVAWCHGAPGILLSRLKIIELSDSDQQDRLKVEFKIALNTTLKEGLGINHCLCHGDFGNLMILKTVAELEKDSELDNKIYSYLEYILNDLENENWKCGLGFVENKKIPGLMLGLSGIGYGLLFLSNPEKVPNLLISEGMKL